MSSPEQRNFEQIDRLETLLARLRAVIEAANVRPIDD